MGKRVMLGRWGEERFKPILLGPAVLCHVADHILTDILIVAGEAMVLGVNSRVLWGS